MRAMLTFTASLAIGLSLMGCNRNQQAQVQAPVATAAPACNCPQQAVAAAVSGPVMHSHRRHHRSEHATPDYSESYSSKTYSSGSESSYAPESDVATEYGDAEAGQSEVHSESAAWIDGYGRAHYAAAAAPDDSNPAVLTAEDVRRREAPWHAYNVDCDRAQ